ncbi:MAG: hypothetical protein ABJH68_01990 [Ilumatobacter sp.]|uniref:hypothetical protein n=1 Tax=Ilumatobacter sp. TaxID=1967498 RepID=UPI0032981CFA
MAGAPTVAAANADALNAATAGLSTSDPRLAAAPADDVPPAPPGTVSEFYPESANLSDCVGLVEKPGCGSDSRGGWRQTLVFVALFAGLGVILWRVSRGISSNRRTIDAAIGDPGSRTRAEADTGSDAEPDAT